MPAFFLALIATFLADAGARDQRLVAALSARLGGSGGLLVTSWIASAATAALAAAAGAGIAHVLPPSGKTMFVALALLLAVGELAWPIVRKEPAEPTRSLIAALLVIASHQVSDGARFLIVALAAATGAPALAGIGGAIGGGAALTLGWALGAGLSRRVPLRSVRLAIAALLLIAAAWAGIAARGLL
jgi:putative Ca2+/H+ antiporter (TMEM165/GDT1 family)